MSSNLKIVHESETQRQHVRISIPASAKISSKLYKVKDISSGGLSIYAEEKLSDGIENIKIFFPFNSYSFHMEVKGKFVNYNPEKKIASYRFVEMNASQVSLINYIIKSYMSGNLVTEGDLISVVNRDNFVKNRSHTTPEKNNIRSGIRKIFPLILIILIGVAGILFFAGNIYEKSSILNSYQSMVEGMRIDVRSYAEGTATFLIAEETEKVTKGQPLISIDRITTHFQENVPPAPNTQITINSPCDCYIQTRHAQSGEFVGYGETMMTLVPNESRLWVTALVSPEKVHNLRLQGDAQIRIAGEGGFVDGHIMEIGTDGLERAYTKVKIKPEIPMALEMLGRPAYVEFLGN